MRWGMLIILLSVCVSLTLGQELVESPQDTTVFINRPAVFRCVTRGADFTIWRVNGTVFGVLPPDIRDDLDTVQETVGDNELYTLAIPGTAEYNGTVVQCVTGVIGGETVESMSGTLKLQELVESPQDTTVFINRPAVFRCVTRGGDFTSWRVNGADLPTNIRDDLDTDQETVGDNELYTLTIPGRAEYNGTVVQCVTGVIGGDSMESLNVTLKIQDILASVGDLMTESSNDSINIYWSAPFSLDVTGVDPDIWYTVLIYNVTDEENPTAVPCTDCLNLTQTHYIFHRSPCYKYKYNFTVIPQNGAGQGESSHNVTGYTIAKPLFDIQAELFIKNMTSNYEIKFNFTGDMRSVCSYMVHVVGPVSFITGPHSGNGGAFDLPHNETDKEFIATFELINAFESMNTSSNFTTFDVQDVTVESMGKGIEMTGEFINGSPAIGCFVVFQCERSTADTYRALQRNGSPSNVDETIELPTPKNTMYRVAVYDLEETGLPNRMPAFTVKEDVNITANVHPTKAQSMFLKQAKISRNGSKVTITCEFMDDHLETSCVLVYREYDNATLTVAVYERSMKFPVTITIDNPENYTISLFGKMDRIEEKPVITIKEKRSATFPSTPAEKDTSDNGNDSSTVILVAVVVAVAVVVVMILLIGGVAAVVTKYKKNGRFSPTTKLCLPSQSFVDSRKALVGLNMSALECMHCFCQRCSHQGSHVEEGVMYTDGGNNTATRQGSHAEEGVVVTDGDSDTVKLEIEKEEAEESKYASVATSSSGASPLSLQEPVKYDVVDHKATKRRAHPHGLLYSDVIPATNGKTSEPKKDDPATQYATIHPHATSPTDGPQSGVKGKETVSKMMRGSPTVGEVTGAPVVPVVVTGPPTVEDVMSLLWSVAGQWKDIAEGLEFDEDLIDEIFTNNATDEACLQDCVEQWMRLGPTWEKLARVLSDMGEESLAEQARSKEANCQRESENSSYSAPSASTKSTTDGSQSMSDAVSESGSGGLDVLVGGSCGELPKQADNDKDNRGSKAAARNGQGADGKPGRIQPYAALQEEGHIYVSADNTYLSEEKEEEEEEENYCSAESETSSSVECSSDEEDDTALLVNGGSEQHFADRKTVLQLARSIYSFCLNDLSLIQRNSEMVVYPQNFELPKIDVVLVQQSNAVTCNTDWHNSENDTNRKVNSGDVLPAPQQCSDSMIQDVATTRAMQSEATVFMSPVNCQTTDSCIPTAEHNSKQSTVMYERRTKLLAPDWQSGATCAKVTGGMFTHFGHKKGKLVASLYLPLIPYPVSEEPLNESHEEYVPPQQPPQEKTPPPCKTRDIDQADKVDTPFKKRQCSDLPENYKKWTSILGFQIVEAPIVDAPFKKTQWSDPPDNFKEKLEKWTYTGIALGFHGPDNHICLCIGGTPIMVEFPPVQALVLSFVCVHTFEDLLPRLHALFM